MVPFEFVSFQVVFQNNHIEVWMSMRSEQKLFYNVKIITITIVYGIFVLLLELIGRWTKDDCPPVVVKSIQGNVFVIDW
jgi:hypothetical protein